MPSSVEIEWVWVWVLLRWKRDLCFEGGLCKQIRQTEKDLQRSTDGLCKQILMGGQGKGTRWSGVAV
jgi:hypothetical protein